MKKIISHGCAVFLLFILCSVFAATPAPLPVEQAFPLQVWSPDLQTVVVQWDIQPGYYLYQDRLQFSPALEGAAQLGPPHFPPAEDHFNPILGHFAAYENKIQIVIPVLSARTPEFDLQIKFQGCSNQGYCYPPVTRLWPVRLGASAVDRIPAGVLENAAANTPKPVQKLLKNPYHWTIWLGFFGLGLLISLTPCVLPMIPVLFGLIVGKEHLSHLRAFFISLFYVLGMSVTYAAAGVLFSWLGGSVQAFMQKPWIIAVFSAFFVAMALSLFGFYQLEPPEKLRALAANLSNRQKRGSLFSAAVMGCLSTLILSPCATPALAGVLGYISQSGNIALGGMALFITGLGGGVPLLLIGIFGRRLLPKSGPWMRIVENLLGVILLGVAIEMLSRILPETTVMVLWAALLTGLSVYMKTFTTTLNTAQRISKGLGLLIFVYAILILAGAVQGGGGLLKPLTLKTSACLAAPTTHFAAVKTAADIERKMQKFPGKPVLLDFYADWCVSCKIMDKKVFGDPAVQKELNHFLLLRADVTANDAQDQELMRYYSVVAPPTIILFNAQHQELTSARIIGEISAPRLKAILSSLP